MLTLGIETTCDDTAIAVVRGKQILSNVIGSQADLHQLYGGVFPEMASRRHNDLCLPILKQALKEAGVTLDQIDLIAVANRPGLIGSLLVGVNFAKGLAAATGKPLIGVNHVAAHLYAAWMGEEPKLPALGVVLSGGHTALLHIESWDKTTLIGQTQDDALGEAFDKVARMLDLPYPGGPHIERLAKEGDPHRYPVHAGKCKDRPYDFSFSGLKTAVLYTLKGQNAQGEIQLTPQIQCDMAASFQRAAFDDVLAKVTKAVSAYNCKSVVLGGGVSQSQTLRTFLAEKLPCPLMLPPPGLSLDNGAMIAGYGTHLFETCGGDDLETLDAAPRITLSSGL